MTFGDFKEGGDLVLKELGVQIAFPSGSHCHLRGREPHHAISRYSGGDSGGMRHSMVMTNKETVRNLYSGKLFPGAETIRNALKGDLIGQLHVPGENEMDDELVKQFQQGNSRAFTQVAYEVQLKHAVEVEVNKKRMQAQAKGKPFTEKPAGEKLGPVAKAAAEQAAGGTGGADAGEDEEDEEQEEGAEEIEEEDEDMEDVEIQPPRDRKRKRSRSRSPGKSTSEYRERSPEDVEMRD
ncbi:hypothetical protein PG990_011649 [Apiospora arundinis]|uniref:Uncharacterized protein n=1 Tax=Apiospora arundinis TaxID=335852 RepID=A0ABR2JIL1_9PEZI